MNFSFECQIEIDDVKFWVDYDLYDNDPDIGVEFEVEGMSVEMQEDNEVEIAQCIIKEHLRKQNAI